jgi:hypothetical protein
MYLSKDKALAFHCVFHQQFFLAFFCHGGTKTQSSNTLL